MGSPEQLFLIAYRALCLELHRKNAALDSYPTLRDLVDRGQPEDIQVVVQHIQAIQAVGFAAGLKDLLTLEEEMDQQLLSGRFTDWSTWHLEFSGPLQVASVGAPTPNRDLSGRVIQDLVQDSRIQPVFYAPVVLKNSLQYVFVWRTPDRAPRQFLENLRALSPPHLESAMIEFFFAFVENTYFNSEWWQGFGIDHQNHLTTLAKLTNPYDFPPTYRMNVPLGWRVVQSGDIVDVIAS